VSNQAHIVIDSVSAVYDAAGGDLVALDGIDLEVQRGEFVSIIGPSGCGKSTLLRIVAGLMAPARGGVTVDGKAPREAQRQKQVGFVFQDPSLLPWRNVSDNVRLPLEVNRRGNTRDPEALIDLVGLGAFRRYYPHQLSGGMQQRVAIARSLVTSPGLLLMDEPFGALDEITRSTMRYELVRIWRSQAEQHDTTVLFVTHSIAEAILLADRVIVFTPQPGRIAADIRIDLPRPRPEEVESDPAFLNYARELRALLRERSPV
jgi:NitT/TauT family transport system ATP-binding protein